MPGLDPPVTPPPRIKLSRLRDIGWTKWDPIGLLGPDQKWEDDDCRAFANEYDTYLIQAAGQLRRGVPEESVVRNLVAIEAHHMGLGDTRDAWDRAQAVVDAIQADADLWIYPG